MALPVQSGSPDDPDVDLCSRSLSLGFRFVRPAGLRLMSLNDRRHRMQSAELTATWRQLVKLSGLNVRRRNEAVDPLLERIRARAPSMVVVELDVSHRRRRDPHNFVPTVKAAIDGLVDAGFLEDDRAELVTVSEPVLRVVPSGWIPTLGIRISPAAGAGSVSD